MSESLKVCCSAYSTFYSTFAQPDGAVAAYQMKGSVEELSKFPKGLIEENGFKVSNLYMRDSDSLHAAIDVNFICKGVFFSPYQLL